MQDLKESTLNIWQNEYAANLKRIGQFNGEVQKATALETLNN